MNTITQNDRFQEAILLADYVIKMALVELSELDQQSIKTLQSIPEYQNNINKLLDRIESAKKILSEARKVASDLININAEVK